MESYFFCWGSLTRLTCLTGQTTNSLTCRLVDLLTCWLVGLLLVLVFAAVFVGYLLEEGEFFDAVGWVVAFGDGFFHVFVPVEHVVLLKAVL